MTASCYAEAARSTKRQIPEAGTKMIEDLRKLHLEAELFTQPAPILHSRHHLGRVPRLGRGPWLQLRLY